MVRACEKAGLRGALFGETSSFLGADSDFGACGFDSLACLIFLYGESKIWGSDSSCVPNGVTTKNERIGCRSLAEMGNRDRVFVLIAFQRHIEKSNSNQTKPRTRVSNVAHAMREIWSQRMCVCVGPTELLRDIVRPESSPLFKPRNVVGPA